MRDRSDLPPQSEVPAPEVFGRGTWPIVHVERGREVGSPRQAFPAWAARQYSQVIAPIHFGLSQSSRVAVAERANLSRNAVQAALDGASWPQFQTIIRLANVAGVELFSLSGRDLVEHGPPLPADEQALLLAYRRMSPADRRRLRQEAFQAAKGRSTNLTTDVDEGRRNAHRVVAGSQNGAQGGSRRPSIREAQGAVG